MNDFTAFFREATTASGRALSPYPYQIELASIPIATRALHVPTGAGKTAAAILSWLFRRTLRAPDAPTRLVYCLPMRVLVEQTLDLARKWVKQVAPEVLVAPLLGGDVGKDWAVHPERPAILVGTQDMLLSRALNRGYALSRYEWPWHFGLVNNDCLWVCDEVQLMGDGLASTAQLSAFRERFQAFGNCPTLWMSATMDTSMLVTIDSKHPPEELALRDADLSAKLGLYERLHAVKSLEKAPDDCCSPGGLARFLANRHRPGTQTLAVVNRVARARETFDELKKLAPDLPHLLHSRFRPAEKRRWLDFLAQDPPTDGRIVIATQVVEAGVDMSSALLVTDLAPWSSLVQRFGRCNRGGEQAEGAKIYWVDRPLFSKLKPDPDGRLTEESALPYSVDELREAEQLLSNLKSASPADLPRHHSAYNPDHVVRQRDLIDLFDTTPDLSGYDLDISRFIRDANSRDVLVAWQSDFPPRKKEDAPGRDELCGVPIADVVPLLKATKKGSPRLPLVIWNALKGRWDDVKSEDSLRPGMIVVANAKAGCYDKERGWDPANQKPFLDARQDGLGAEEESIDDEPLTFLTYTQSLKAHTREVCDAMGEILDGLTVAGIPVGPYRDQLLMAALYHDWGKIHAVFQRTVNPDSGFIPLAKSETKRRHGRPRFRHELASALALLQMGAPDLVVYLAAAHHGKVRVSIRALPDENKPQTPGARFARGIWDGDELPPTDLDGILTTSVTLNLEPMLLGLSASGAPSWMERMLALRDELGPFRLAYLEALVVAADRRASGSPREVLRCATR
jgi:CRISPR-associated endonuclease/helicase Cas3